jgi:IclR family acetate operon transcriptional repressor
MILEHSEPFPRGRRDVHSPVIARYRVATIGRRSSSGQDPPGVASASPLDDPGLNQSVQKAAAILRAAAQRPRGESVSGLARAVGLPRATALRLIRTLESEGLLVRFPEHDRVVLGLELQRLARAVDVRELLIEASRRPLEELAERTHETITLTVVEPDGSLAVVKQIDPPHLLKIADWLGRRYPLHASSSGKLLLSTLSDEQLAPIVSAPLERLTEWTITDGELLRRELDDVRTNGFAVIVDELELGIASISIGIRVRERLAAMLNVTGPTLRFDDALREAAVPQALAAARSVELALDRADQRT